MSEVKKGGAAEERQQPPAQFVAEDLFSDLFSQLRHGSGGRHFRLRARTSSLLRNPNHSKPRPAFKNFRLENDWKNLEVLLSFRVSSTLYFSLSLSLCLSLTDRDTLYQSCFVGQ